MYVSVAVHSYVAVDNVQNRVKGLLSMVQDWEQKMRAALKEK